MLCMARPPGRDKLKVGLSVEIETKENQGTGILTTGIIRGILTASRHHPYGIKVRLDDGQVGRVKNIIDTAAKEQVQSPANLKSGNIPKTEDKYNEFKEFYQYDMSIEKLPFTGAGRQKAIDGIMNSVRERFATAVCAFGNDTSGGSVHLGIRADGTIMGLERDKQIGNFDDYDDSFANHIRDTLEKFLKDKVFIIRKIEIKFRRISDKTICTISVRPAQRPLYVHVGDEQRFFVRGPAPRSERLVDQKDQFRYIKFRFPNYEG